MDAAIAADATAGYWTTRSAWVLTAIDAAITTAQNRAGGTLPSPPHPTRPAPQPASAKGFAMTILSLLLPVAVLGFIEVAWWGLRWIEVQQGGAK